jgi:hypothetical protein
VIPRAVGGTLAAVGLLACGLETRGRILWGPVSEAGSEVDLTKEQGGDGGIAHSDTCPANQAVIGYQGEVTDADGGLVTPVVSRIETVCGVLTLDGTASNQVVVGPGSTLPERGLYSGSTWAQMCGPDQVITGFVGRSGAFIDQLSFECGHFIASSSGAGPAFTMDTMTTTYPAAGGDGGSAFPAVPCPPGQMAIGTALRSGFFVDAFSLICGTPPVPADAGP